MTVDRKDVPQKDRWNVEALYPNSEAWEKDFQIYAREGKNRWPEIDKFKGTLHNGPEALKSALEYILNLDRYLSKLYTYAHLRHDEDISQDGHKSAFARITAVLHEFSQAASWFEPELLALDNPTIEAYLHSPVLKEYQFHLEKIVRIKKHMLSADNEALMAMAGQALDTSYKAFSALNDADFKFGKVQDYKGEDKELTHALYGLYIRGTDRVLRQNAFIKMHNHYANYENTLCELVSGQVKKHIFNAKARNYSNSLEAALFPKNIDTSVYSALIEAVNNNLQGLHRYVKLRKKWLKLDRIHLYDMYVPMASHLDITMPYEEAEENIIESVAPLGSDYQNKLRDGMKTQRWVDRYENKNKRSGGYSSGCFDSMPYILMNYKGILRDVFTLAHEAGHSMHSLLSRTSQPYHYSDYSIFLAEVASTFNEELLMQHLLKKAKTKEEKIYYINQKIDDIRGTLYRQTMFAEFELAIHEKAESDQPLTPAVLRAEMQKLNEKYFGPEMTLDPISSVEWARIPHFYYNFYVYQYATGISAALCLADKVLNGGDQEREAYLSYLKAGSSKYPIDILKNAGVDMHSAEPVNTTLTKFNRLVDELEALQN